MAFLDHTWRFECFEALCCLKETLVLDKRRQISLKQFLPSHQRKWAHHEKRAHHVQLCFLKGNNFGGCPSLTPRFALLTQNQESYNTKHSIYLESMLMQCYGNYICKIAFVVLWLSTYFALFFKWGRMSITDAPNLTIPQKSICQIQNISLAKL